ncbi:BMP family ABC transporter substrate-binding protein [Lysinibacillus alkalisoli]|uniref:BMP family ABC transporter substrate-binding protein n=1 Tax=Lysinibacillus alkalisoli TaxID=1911548 RepID=A0A917LDY4_9BACI|nr:BMP family ABC transporter substrate-binding protein [Lysinibacillus alkalisoli]GGG14699.1 BMP family ABC transporter substrate-binding protein [Lysinibacillus alkalisoli]
MKHMGWIVIGLIVLLAGCSTKAEEETRPYRVGIVLSDAGLGDESFNDLAFNGLTKARDELGILFDYKEVIDGNYEQQLEQLVTEQYDAIIGLGFSAQKALTKVAEKYPQETFILVDGQADASNIISITFKEHEASFLIGMLAALTSTNKQISFIGGEVTPVIQHFEAGYIQGARYIDKDIAIKREYANDFNNAKLGEQIALQHMDQGADFIYHAAGFSGFGALQAAEKKGVYAAGVDTDQFFIAEKAVVTSMLKNVDQAIYQVVNDLLHNQEQQQHYELGLKEAGVGLAPLRVISAPKQYQRTLDKAKEAIIKGELIVKEEVQ